MADNIIVALTDGEKYNPDVPAPCQVRIEFHDGVQVDPVRTWTVDAPSKFVATCIKSGLDNMTNATYVDLYGSFDADNR